MRADVLDKGLARLPVWWRFCRKKKLLAATSFVTVMRLFFERKFDCARVIIRKEDRMLHSFFAREEEGQGLVEYALILVLIAIVVIGILTLLGGKVSEVFSSINSGLG
jgi:pilus assembly protein Flp/PilA